MPYQHILIAVDLTDECHPVVERALAIAASSGAKAALVHIVEPMAMAFGGDVPMDLSLLQQQQFDQARERLQSLAGRYPQRAELARWAGLQVDAPQTGGCCGPMPAKAGSTGPSSPACPSG